MEVYRFWIRNGVALAGLLLTIYLPDAYAIQARSGWAKWTPYLFVLLLYAWIVFHNRILFERLFEQGRRRAYAGWTGLILGIGTLNMLLILHYGYRIEWPIAVLVKFYVFSITGAGVYVIYRQVTDRNNLPEPSAERQGHTSPPFVVLTEGGRRVLDPGAVLYVESLENYVRVITGNAVFVTRLTMKQAAEQLPSGMFVRISRSHLVNVAHIVGRQGNELTINGKNLRVGRTYKQHVAERLKQTGNALKTA